MSRAANLRVLSGFFVCALLAACGRYFAPDINLDRYATEQEITGRWVLTAASLAVAQRDGYQSRAGTSHEIFLRADGTCDFRSLQESGQIHNTVYLEVHVTWKLKHDTPMSERAKRKNEIFITVGRQGISLYLTEEKGGLHLWDHWGDPDAWEFLKYERRG